MDTKMPLIILKSIVLFPNNTVSFEVSGQRALFAVHKAYEEGGFAFFSAHKGEDGSDENVYETGTVASIKRLFPLSHEKVQVVAFGENKAVIKEFVTSRGFQEVLVTKVYPDKESGEGLKIQGLMLAAKSAFDAYYSAGAKVMPETERAIAKEDDPFLLCDLISGNLDVTGAKKQELLEMDDPERKLTELTELLLERAKAYEYQGEIIQKARKKVDKSQRDYFLREQQKAISEELGEPAGVDGEIAEYEKRAAELNLPEFVTEKLKKEFKRLKNFGHHAQEGALIRDYIQVVLETPWTEKTEENPDLKLAAQILDEDHYGLFKVKERIIEFLAVRQNVKNPGATVLCLAGPPGTGKTSIAKSIAGALNRKYARMSLGGVRDEAEIRGHRRTYVGSMPGRLIYLMGQTKVTNPVILLDEIDKLSSDHRGDPSAALLEVLDGEQNKNFRDHYLEINYDLSDVFFIITANTTEGIIPALKDRLEIIELSSYTYNEKEHIAKGFLVAKQKEKTGAQVEITDEVIRDIIKLYTKEAGVRQLERLIGKICQKAVKAKLMDGAENITVGPEKLRDYLGAPKYKEERMGDNPPGVVTGLAYTSVGGAALLIEAVAVKGRGRLNLTGSLGDVMKESAQAAMGFIRANAESLDINPDFYKNTDIHLHIPQGAVPKDGPSAGLAICLAMVSALTGKRVRKDLALTGEISITGRALPIGGLKEKLLGARAFGVKTVIIPGENGPDISDIEEEAKEGIQIVQVDSIRQVLDTAFCEN